MNKERMAGAVEQAKGALKILVGETIGDAKLVADGKAEKIEGKIRNAIGGLQDAAEK